MKEKCYNLTNNHIMLLLTAPPANKTLKNRLNDLLRKKKRRKKKKRKTKRNVTKKIKISRRNLGRKNKKIIKIKKSRKKN